jgi:hypothetical protein
MQCDSTVTHTEAKMKTICDKPYKSKRCNVTVTLKGRDHMTGLLNIQYCFRES